VPVYPAASASGSLTYPVRRASPAYGPPPAHPSAVPAAALGAGVTIACSSVVLLL
jgi:hypothetical protein